MEEWRNGEQEFQKEKEEGYLKVWKVSLVVKTSVQREKRVLGHQGVLLSSIALGSVLYSK